MGEEGGEGKRHTVDERGLEGDVCVEKGGEGGEDGVRGWVGRESSKVCVHSLHYLAQRIACVLCASSLHMDP